jgi:cytochrome c biogenesis protein CcmG, thiol:disulfide interchange protein DsbE
MGLRLPLLAFVTLLVAVVSACAGRETRLAPPRERLPEVSVIGLDRQATSLPALTRGQPALVALWATWCKSCAKELAELDRLQERVQGRALVVAVAVGEPYDTVRDFVAPRGLRYAQLIDEQFRLADALGTERVPSTLVVDRAGTVRYSGGALDGAALDALREAIGE